MDDRTKRALLGSIEKWRKIVHEGGEDKGGVNCPLCLEFKGCVGCLVYNFSGRSKCRGTPYEDWLNHQDERHGMYPIQKTYCSECRVLATKELEFLESLLPKEDNHMWGWFWYSQTQDDRYVEIGYTAFNVALLDSGLEVRYTEMSSRGTKPSGNFNDFIYLGHGRWFRQEKRIKEEQMSEEKSGTEDRELKVMESRVKAAMEKCPAGKEILKELFPDVEKDQWIEFKPMVEFLHDSCGLPSFTEGVFPYIRHNEWNLWKCFPTGWKQCHGVPFNFKHEGGKFWKQVKDEAGDES